MKSIVVKENFLNLFGLALLSACLVTIIGFFDEGHQQIYGSFYNYLSAGGYPPTVDYIAWVTLGSLPGMISFNLISLGMKKTLFRYRFLLAFVCTPLFFLFLLFGIGAILSI